VSNFELYMKVLLGVTGAIAAFTAVPQVHAQTPTEFQQGFADREAFESWFAGLSGEYRDGADFWAGQRSLRNPVPCASLGGQATEGCNAAKARLDVSDARRKLAPAYRQDWNSYVQFCCPMWRLSGISQITESFATRYHWPSTRPERC
jgi:hypothetical protein